MNNIIRLSFENITSFKNRQDIYFNKTNSEEILPISAIYGENSSGKSNLIDIFKLPQKILSNWRSTFGEIFYEKFKSSDTINNSFWELEFILNGKIYEFSIIFNDIKIVKEKLTIDNDVVYYKNNLEIFLKENIANLDFEDILGKKTILILDMLRRLRVQFAIDVFDFFDTLCYKMNLLLTVQDTWTLNRLKENLKPDYIFRKKILSFLQKLDQNISRIRITDNDIYLGYKIDNKIQYILLSSSGKGVEKYFFLLLQILPSLEKDGIPIIIDDFDVNLHPIFLDHIIDLFNDKKINKTGCQLIFTTHNTHIMQKLTMTEIWFVSKNKKGVSEIYPLSDFIDGNENDDKENKYLLGEYGAIPYINNK